jgi:hypothetical protein
VRKMSRKRCRVIDAKRVQCDDSWTKIHDLPSASKTLRSDHVLSAECAARRTQKYQDTDTRNDFHGEHHDVDN